MGSFNTTCFVSHQTIKPGQKVYVTALYQSYDYAPVEVTHEVFPGNIQIYSVVANRGSTCYPTAFWTPLSEYITAEYSDYGAVTIDNTPENLRKVRSLVAQLTKACPTVELGSNEYHDVAFNLKTKPELTIDSSYEDHVAIWDHIWEAVFEDRAFIVRGKQTALLGFSIMLQVTGDYLVTLTEKSTDWNNNPMDMKSLLERKTNDFISRFKNMAEDTHKDNAKVKDFVVTFASQELFRLADFGISDTRLPINLEPTTELYEALASQYKVTADLINPITAETLDKLYKSLYSSLQFLYIDSGVCQLNLKYSPMIYAGQDYDNEIGRNYLKLVQHVAAEIKKEIDFENEDEEDDE